MDEYKQEDGKVLKGFSQVDLDLLNKNLKRQTILYGIIGFILILILLWGFWQMKRYRIVSLIIEALAKC